MILISGYRRNSDEYELIEFMNIGKYFYLKPIMPTINLTWTFGIKSLSPLSSLSSSSTNRVNICLNLLKKRSQSLKHIHLWSELSILG